MSRNRQRDRTQEKDLERFNQVIDKIKNLEHWGKYEIYDLARFEGDAYMVAKAVKNGVESTQIRKYYNEVMAGYYALSHPTRQDDITARTKIAMLIPRAHYSLKRQSKTINEDFLKFLKAATDLSKFRTTDKKQFKEDYERFMQFFEAVVGYHKFLSKK